MPLTMIIKAMKVNNKKKVKTQYRITMMIALRL